MFNKSAIKERKQIVRLLHKYVKGELNVKERNRLDAWAAESPKNQELLQKLSNEQMLAADLASYSSFQWDDIAQKLAANGVPIVEGAPIRRMDWGRFMAAAAALIIMVIASYLLVQNKRKSSKVQQQEIAVKQKDIPPGKYKARLTIADGSTIVLDSMNTDSLTKQGAAKLSNKNGQLVYKAGAQIGSSLSPAINILTTAKAETYQLLLSDGSKVWLNSGSSIRFPVYFTGKERKVEVTGEAFFEIAHDVHRPFIVKVNNMEVQVLGTTFNVNSYEDEGDVKTTLVSGKVKIVNREAGSEQMAILAPGQQAQVKNENIKVVSQVDVDQVMAWRNGLFQFNRTDIRTVMRQIARWYDVDVSYEGEVPNKEFWGKISRDLNASEMLKILEKYGVHFKIQGKKIIVTP